jgi:outer membrane protein TolC
MQTFRRMSIAVALTGCLLTSAWAATPPRELTVTDAIALALQHNPALHAAHGKADAASAQISQARAAQQPQIQLSSGDTYVTPVPSVQLAPNAPSLTLGLNNTWVTTMSAKQVLYSGGRLSALVRQATDAAHAVDATNARTRQEVAYNAASTFLTLLTAQRAKGVAQQALDTAQDHLKIAQARLDARAAPRFDVLRAQVDVATAQQNVVQADADIEVAQAALQDALGVDVPTFIAMDPNFVTTTPTSPIDVLMKQANSGRPELRALDWQHQAANAALSAAKALKRPTVSLQAGYQEVTPESVELTSQWSVAAAASLPIFDGGLSKAEQREAKAQREQVDAAVETLHATIASEVKQARARLVSAAAQIDVAQQNVALATEALRIANVRYEAGVATATEVADAETTLTSARLGLTNNLGNWGIAAAALRLATGATE